MKIKKYLWSNS